MSLREFDRYVVGFNKRREYEREVSMQIAALQTAEMINIIAESAGKVFKKWKAVQPKRLLDAWTGQQADAETPGERWERIMRRHHARLEREKAKKVSASTVEPGS